MANVAHLVRASGCGSEGSGFDPRHSPQNKIRSLDLILFWGDAKIEPAGGFSIENPCSGVREAQCSKISLLILQASGNREARQLRVDRLTAIYNRDLATNFIVADPRRVPFCANIRICIKAQTV